MQSTEQPSLFPATPPPRPAAAEFTEPARGRAWCDTYSSPLGELLLTGDGRSLTGIFLDRGEAPPPAEAKGALRDRGPFRAVHAELDAYFEGELREFSVPLAPRGTPFQLLVWRELTGIPYGTTTTYGALARAVGRPSASRAVGLANGRNPLPVVVPCHRVVGADGSLTGYSGGLDRKRRLLALEQGMPI